VDGIYVDGIYKVRFGASNEPGCAAIVESDFVAGGKCSVGDDPVVAIEFEEGGGRGVRVIDPSAKVRGYRGQPASPPVADSDSDHGSRPDGALQDHSVSVDPRRTHPPNPSHQPALLRSHCRHNRLYMALPTPPVPPCPRASSRHFAD
jgi:hypothetical protein